MVVNAVAIVVVILFSNPIRSYRLDSLQFGLSLFAVAILYCSCEFFNFLLSLKIEPSQCPIVPVCCGCQCCSYCSCDFVFKSDSFASTQFFAIRFCLCLICYCCNLLYVLVPVYSTNSYSNKYYSNHISHHEPFWMHSNVCIRFY